MTVKETNYTDMLKELAAYDAGASSLLRLTEQATQVVRVQGKKYGTNQMQNT